MKTENTNVKNRTDVSSKKFLAVYITNNTENRQTQQLVKQKRNYRHQLKKYIKILENQAVHNLESKKL